jgi:NADPH:quinone reductase-like Zn-dependent oxidoreductase/acyl carrier protein
LPVEIRRASRAQPLLLAVQVAVVEALRERGIEPQAVIGHSVGEIAAAWCAGALDIESAIRVVLVRSQRQEITRHGGAMAAVLVSPGDMQALLSHGAFPQLEIAAFNSGRSVTVAGPKADLETFLKYAEQERWGVRRLDLDYPFHCALVDPIESQLLDDLDGLAPIPSRIPFISTVTGGTLPGETLDARYWWRNVRAPVNFAGGVKTLVDNGMRVLLEIGPHPVLGGYLHEALRSTGTQGVVIPTLARDPDSDTDEILSSAARVLIAGGRVDIDRFAGPMRHPAVELPNYAWQHRSFQVGPTGEALSTFAAPSHPLLGQPTRTGSGVWYATVDSRVLPWLGDHRVEDAAVFPAAGFIEVALAAGRETFGDVPLEIRDLEILQPLVFDDDRSFEITTRLSGEINTIEIHSRPRPVADDAALNAKATITPAPVADGHDRYVPLAEASLDAAELYALADRRGLSYGPAFQRIAAVEVIDARNGRAELRAQRLDGFVLDPTALDAAFHLLIALVECDPVIDPNALLLPVRARSLRVYRPGAPVASASARITSSTKRSVVADVLLFDQAGAVIADLRDARCRIVSRSVKETPDDLVYRMSFESLHRVSLPSAFPDVCVDGPASILSDAARNAGYSAEQRDVALVLEAGARSSACDVVLTLTGRDGRLVIADLVAEGKVALSAWPLLSQMLLVLSDAGLVREQDDGWTLVPQPDMPGVAELVDTLVTRYPAWIAEATCLARLPELLPALVRDGLDQGLGYSRAVLDHLERGSPAAARLAGLVYQGAADIVERWPADRPLRILVIGAANLSLAAKVGAKAPRATIVVTDPRTAFLDTVRRSAFSDERLSMTPWEQAIGPAAGYDLILCAGSLHRVAAAPGRLDLMAQTLCSGGALIAAEPLPSLFTDLAYGQTPDWWARSISPDFPTGTIMPERDWVQTLEQAGLTDETVQSIDGGVLISAVMKKDRVAPAADVVSRSMLVVADAETQTFADLLQQRLQQAARVVPFHTADGRSQRRVRKVTLTDVPDEFRSGQPITDVVLVANARHAGGLVEALTRPLTAMIRLATAADKEHRFCLWIVCSGALSGIADDRGPHPIQTGLWAAARVIQNEFPDIDVRCMDIDPQLALDVAASRAAETIAHPSSDKELMLGANGEAALRVLRGGLLPDRADGEVVRLEFAQTGVFDSFIWRPAPRTALAADQVEIAVAATGLNFRDVMWSLGLLPDEALENGFTGPAIGMECSGIVSAAGANVKNLRIGDRVVAFTSGGFASSIVVDARMAARIPDDISLESAATLPVAFLTAYYALVHLARLQPGETVLIHGGAGGVGLAALQIARLRGARVIATAGSADRRTLLHALGADHVFDSRSLSFADDVQRVSGGVDVVLNSLAGEAMERSVACLKPFGRFLELGKRDYYQNRHLGLRPFRNNLSYFGIDADQLLIGHRALTEQVFGELMDLFADGQLVPLPYRMFEGENAADAFRLMQRSGQVGKILIRPPQARPKTVVKSGFKIDPRGQYLIVGGLGGFGFATAQWLVAKGARHLALMSRSGRPAPEVAGEIAALKAGGVTVDVVAVDVADAAALERYFWTLDGGPPLKGVFHAAMVLDDGFAADLDRSRIEAVLKPKVAGAANLDRLTRRFDLDCFVLFSSVAVMIGNVGQASYVAANGYLDGLARRRRAEGLPALAVGFGAIGDVGYLARNAQAGAALSQRLGRSTLTAAEALAGLEALLQTDPHDVTAAAVVFARVDWALARKELKLVRSSLFERLQLEDIASDGSSLAVAELLRQLRDLPDIEVQAKLADLIDESIVRTLRLPAGEVDRNRPLSEFGMDSLMMLELRMAVEEQMGIEIPLMSLTSSLTIFEISKRLTGILRSQDKALMSGQMSALAQEHIEIPTSLSDAEVAATAAAVARRAKSVDRIL